MHTVRDDFEEKRVEATILLEHVKELSGLSGNINKVAIVKSAFMVLLYNAIESTTVLVLERVHEKVSRHKYDELSEPLKKLFAEFYLFKEGKRKQHLNLNSIINNLLNFPTFEELTKKVNLFSGNLDARELSNILSRYGIGKITASNKEKLLIVKNKRNQIAHGEVMFKECCRNYTYDDLSTIKTAVFDSLNQMIELAERYFENSRYLDN